MMQHPFLMKIIMHESTIIRQGTPTPRDSIRPPAGRSNPYFVGRLQFRISHFPWRASNPYLPISPERGAEAIPEICVKYPYL